MVDNEIKQSPTAQRQSNPVESGHNVENLFSPRLKSLAAMAGWDEESILVASLIVEDTPDRQFKLKKRSDLTLKTPPSNSSRRKRRNQRRSPISISVPVINLDEEKPENQENWKEKNESKIEVEQESKRDEVESSKQDSGVSCSKAALPCMDKLKEELSCAICLEICYEPSTTSCGHSFCKKCLKSAADKCGKKCPKCRQLISNGRSCTVNTVLWNTIQLLFPEEVEARKAAAASNSREKPTRKPGEEDIRARSLLLQQRRQGPRSWRVARIEDFGDEESPPLLPRHNARRGQEEDSSALAQRVQGGEEIRRFWGRDESGRSRRGTTTSRQEEAERSMQRENLSWVLERGGDERGRRRGTPSQDEDAALALRLQREEFMGAFRGSNDTSISLARANLRAMASRATNNLRNRSRPPSFF